MSTFKQFLEIFSKEIYQSSVTVYYNPSKSCARENEVLVGVGKSEDGGYLFTNKQKGNNFSSVTEYIYDIYENKKFSPKIDINNTSFFVEDLSPDTCMSIILLFARNSNVPIRDIPIEWIHYINRWEKGDVKTTGEPQKSWGALLNALSHEYIRVSQSRQSVKKLMDGLKICVSFTLDLLQRDVNPANVPNIDGSQGYHKARAILNIEHQEYQQLLSNAELLQLEIPLQHSDRKLLVDTFIVTELKTLGTLKNFTRTDTTHSFLKSGFGFMILHRPHLQGTGNDITLSVDPSIGIHLHDLWRSLEEKEEELWAGTRPNHDKRQGYQVNQPWYINQNETLIGAPQKVEIIDQASKNKEVSVALGSKLNWNDVLSEVWNVYNPIKHLKVHPYISNGQWGKACSISESFSVAKINQKRFVALKWASTNTDQSIILTPTIKRYLIACLLKQTENPMIEDLPLENSYDFLDFPSGFALIHSQGVVFFDDWSKEKSRIELFQTEFNHLLERYNALQKFQTLITEENTRVKNELEDKKKVHKNFINLSDNLAKIKMDLQDSILRTMSSSNDFHIQVFIETVQKRWGLNTQLDHLYHSVNEIENTIKSIVETRTNRVISGITIYGFPFVLFGSIFQKPLYESLTMQSFEWGSLASFTILSLLGTVILKKVVQKE